MGLPIALGVYGTTTAAGWVIAGTGGVIVVVPVVLLVEHRLARWRALAPVRHPEETDRAHR